MQDIIVLIALDTKAEPRETLLPLLLSTEGAHPYKEYNGIDKVALDFAPGSKTHACAAALFGQTERAPAPIEKCAIFGIAPTVLTGSEEEPVETPITDADVVAALEQLREEQDDFFFVLPVDADPARILALSDWAKGTVLSEAKIRAGEIEAEKLLIAQTDSKTFECSNAQTVICYNWDAAVSYMHAAWVGRVAPNYPTAVTWKWKEVDGIPLTDLEGRALHELLERNINTYARNNKRNYMREGICCDGEFIDTITSRWKIKLKMRKKLTDLHVDNEVVPYDDAGFTMIGAALIQALDECVNDGDILTQDGKGVYKITIPRRTDATHDQAARRIVPDIHWAATLRGGSHGVTVRGILSVSIVNSEE